MKRGRKSGLDLQPELTKRVCVLLSEGVSIKSACNLAGICERAYHDWQTRGRAGEKPYSDFFDAASRARDSWKARLISRIEFAAGRGDWRAAAFLLERQFPAEFGGKGEEVAGTLPPPIINVTIQRDEATDEARKRFGTPPPNRLRTRTL